MRTRSKMDQANSRSDRRHPSRCPRSHGCNCSVWLRRAPAFHGKFCSGSQAQTRPPFLNSNCLHGYHRLWARRSKFWAFANSSERATSLPSFHRSARGTLPWLGWTVRSHPPCSAVLISSSTDLSEAPSLCHDGTRSALFGLLGRLIEVNRPILLSKSGRPSHLEWLGTFLDRSEPAWAWKRAVSSRLLIIYCSLGRQNHSHRVHISQSRSFFRLISQSLPCSSSHFKSTRLKRCYWTQMLASLRSCATCFYLLCG